MAKENRGHKSSPHEIEMQGNKDFFFSVYQKVVVTVPKGHTSLGILKVCLEMSELFKIYQNGAYSEVVF